MGGPLQFPCSQDCAGGGRLWGPVTSGWGIAPPVPSTESFPHTAIGASVALPFPIGC